MPEEEIRPNPEPKFEEERLRELAFIDDLTGLYNRRYLYQYLPQEIQKADSRGLDLTLLMMDVDKLKQINDTYGHLRGDKVLAQLSDLFRKSFRGGDTVVRYAGDEFMAILPGAKDTGALPIAKRTAEKVANFIFKGDGQPDIRVTISVGIASYPQDATDPEKLIAWADQALYSSKRGGRNRVSLTTEIPKEVLSEQKIQEAFPCPKLVGRQKELDELANLFNMAKEGRVELVVVTGEAGIGKTRLLNELARYAKSKGANCILGRCSEEIANQPYQILALTLTRIFEDMGEDVAGLVSDLAEVELVELVQLLPTLRPSLTLDSLPKEALSPTEKRFHLLEGLSKVFVNLSKRNMLFILLDDFHWTDLATLNLINHIIRNIKGAPIFICAALRRDDLESRKEASLRELVEQMKKDGILQDIVLRLLDQNEVLEMIGAMFPGMDGNLADFINAVYKVTEGNPLFVEESLRNLTEKGLIFYQENRWQRREIREGDIPVSLKEIVRRRFDKLDEETKEMIANAAVIGQDFDFSTLRGMGERNEGFVLELIDRAKKLQLVRGKEVFSDNEFNFASGLLRDVLYDWMEHSRKKLLHQKLAQTREGLFKDDLAQMAGAIAYHFEKAENLEKATQYANVSGIRSKGFFDFDEAIKYLQEALLERVGEIEIPITKDSLGLVTEAVGFLRAAAVNVELYPSGNKMRINSIDDAYKKITKILEKNKTLTFSESEGTLLVNGRELEKKEFKKATTFALATLLIDRRIRSISFRRGFDDEEFVTFLELLKEKREKLEAQGGISEVLKGKNVFRIRIDEVRYEKITKEIEQKRERQKKFEDMMLIDYLTGRTQDFVGDKREFVQVLEKNPQELAEFISRIATTGGIPSQQGTAQAQAPDLDQASLVVIQSLQRIGNQLLAGEPGGWVKYKNKLADVFLNLEPQLRTKIFQKEVPISSSMPEDVIGGIIGELPDKELINTILSTYAQKEKSIKNMRRLVLRLLSDPIRKNKISPTLKDELTKVGISEGELDLIMSQRSHEHLTSLSAQSYAEMDLTEEVKPVFNEVVLDGKDDVAGVIIQKVLDNIASDSPDIRRRVAENLMGFIEVLISNEKYNILTEMVDKLLDAFNKENDTKIYSALIKNLDRLSVEFILRGKYNLSERIIKAFKQQISPESSRPKEQQELVKGALDRIGESHIIDRLIKAFRDRIETDYTAVASLLVNLGDRVVEPLINVIIEEDMHQDPFRAYISRRSAAFILKDIGEVALGKLKERLSDRRSSVVKNIVEALGHIADKSLMPSIELLLGNPDPRVVKAAKRSLEQIKKRL